MARALDAEVPVLGLCLGGQLLACAAGGGVERMAEPFIGWPRLTRLSAAAGDALFGGLPGEAEVLEWHNDAIEPPPAAVVLAETGGPGCSIFRAGPAAWGSQIHLELTPAMLARWLEDDDLARDVAAAGVDPAGLLADAARRLAAQGRVAETVFERFADVLLAHR
ncbi:MAG: glutamine amidotransferase-related protein [Gaiellaceae bacterium]